MKKIGLILVLVLLLSSGALAKSETIDFGPYKVSFDLGAPCFVKVQEPKESEDLAGGKYVMYAAEIKSGDNNAEITLMDYKPYISCKLGEQDIKYVNSALNTMNCKDVRVVERTFDNIPGVLGLGYIQTSPYMSPDQLFYAQYWPDYKEDCGSLRCNIISFIPFDEGTLNLIKSIHVENV